MINIFLDVWKSDVAFNCCEEVSNGSTVVCTMFCGCIYHRQQSAARKIHGNDRESIAVSCVSSFHGNDRESIAVSCVSSFLISLSLFGDLYLSH